MLTPGSFHEILNANNSALNRKAVRQSTYTVKVLKQFRTSMRIPNECLDLFNNSNEQFPHGCVPQQDAAPPLQSAGD